MSYQHKQLAEGKWRDLSFVEQMANVGSEVGRAIVWKQKGQENLSKNAFYRALELLGLTIDLYQGTKLNELTRVREFLLDYFVGDNQYASSDQLWNKYFMAFNVASRLSR